MYWNQHADNFLNQNDANIKSAKTKKVKRGGPGTGAKFSVTPGGNWWTKFHCIVHP